VNGEVLVKVKATPEILVNTILWSADSEDQDFRDETWTDSTLNKADKTDFEVRIKKPVSGYKAFYIDLQYKATFGGDYTQSTRMFVADSIKLLLRSN
jgi:PhoPQ-activated pathogenicity-related protein